MCMSKKDFSLFCKENRHKLECGFFPWKELKKISVNEEAFQVRPTVEQVRPTVKYVTVDKDTVRIAFASIRGVKIFDTNIELFSSMDSITDGLLKFSPVGTFFAQTAVPTIKIWNFKTEEEEKNLEGHPERFSIPAMYTPQDSPDKVTCMEFSPDGMLLASGSFFNIIKLWNIKSGQCKKIDDGMNHYGISCLAFSPDSRFLASASAHLTIKIRDVKTGDLVKELPQDWKIPPYFPTVSSMAFSPDGLCLAASTGGRVILFDVENGRGEDLYSDENYVDVEKLVFSPDGYLATSGKLNEPDDGTPSRPYHFEIKIWNVEKKTCRNGNTLKHENPILSLDFSPDGFHLVSADMKGNITLYSRHNED